LFFELIDPISALVLEPQEKEAMKRSQAVALMKNHVQEWASKKNIKIRVHPGQIDQAALGRKINGRIAIPVILKIPEIDCPGYESRNYATALHELGHAYGKWQSPKPACELSDLQVQATEIGAWLWAVKNAKFWNSKMTRNAVESLATYGVEFDNDNFVSEIQALEKVFGKLVR
jgi:hypothetical protein